MQAVASSGDQAGRADLELENAKLRAELSALPQLKTELESLKARVTELSLLSGAGVCRRAAARLTVSVCTMSCLVSRSRLAER